MQTKSKVVITGANGFVAKNLRRYLHSNNIPVISIARRDFTKFDSETKIISPDYSLTQILPKIKNCNTMFHLVGVGKQTITDDYNTVNTNLASNIVGLCKKSKIHKIIFNSGLGVAKNSTMGYFISKYNAERQIIDSGLDYTIFRPSYIIGKDDLLSKNLKKQVKSKKLILPGSGKYKIQPISIFDVCKIFHQTIIDKKFSNKIIDLVGPQTITFEKYLQLIATSKKIKIKKIDLEQSYYQAIHNPNSLYGVDDLNILIGNFLGNDKIKKLYTYSFTTIKQMLKTSGLL